MVWRCDDVCDVVIFDGLEDAEERAVGAGTMRVFETRRWSERAVGCEANRLDWIEAREIVEWWKEVR